MTRSTGTYAISTTLGESVRAFVPHPLPPMEPTLAPALYEGLNRQAELALARLAGALEDLGIVSEMTGQKKNRSYSYQAYVEVLSR